MSKTSKEICEELTGEDMDDMGLVEACEENDDHLIDGIEEHQIEPCDNADCRYWDPAYQDCVASDCFYLPEDD